MSLEKSGLEDYAVEAFREHWADVLRRARKGRSLGRKLWRCFEADTNARSRELAMEFFGVAHARRMCRLTPKQIRRRLACYLPRGIEWAVEEFSETGEQRDFIRELVTGIYVIFDSDQCASAEDYDERFKGLSVATYPAPVLYDDWYERSIGSSWFTCGTMLLMKSTGEGFTRTEFEWLERAIQWNLDSNEPEALYGFECEPLTASKVWVKIYTIDRGLYEEWVMGQASRLTGPKLRSFIDGAVECLARQGERVPRKKGRSIRKWVKAPVPEATVRRLREEIFGDLSRQSDSGILEGFGRLLDRKDASDVVLREIEDELNGILGQERRDYHCGMNCCD